MIAVITGDVVRSSQEDPALWLKSLKEILAQFGRRPQSWELSRGDSFQVKLQQPEAALAAALQIKAAMRNVPGLDVRMGIGIGAQSFKSKKISEANGDAFVHSGTAFESLKTAASLLAVRSPWPETDNILNLMLTLAAIGMNAWTPASARLVLLQLRQPQWGQKAVAQELGIAQSSVSERRNRACLPQILQLERYFRRQITAHLS